MRRWLSLTQADLGKCIPSGELLALGKKACSLEELACHFLFHVWSVQCASLLFSSSTSLISSSAAGTNGCLDLSY